MAITRRQFVTRLGALAAAAGFSQVEASKIMDAMAYDPPNYGGVFGKPRVVWLHGAECTGCSTSLLGIFENLNGIAVEGTSITTATAAVDAGIVPVNNGLVGAAPSGPNANSPWTLGSNNLSPDPDGSMNIADVVIDVIDLLYHETVMGMGGDVAYEWLKDFAANNAAPFVLVVEGAMQATANGGAWGDVSTVPWCSIAHDNTVATGPLHEIVTAEMVKTLADSALCIAVIPIGQCATFGGYPGCKPPISTATAGFDTTKSQTDAKGVYDFLAGDANAQSKVINVPGCPTNPWWFVLSVVAFLVDLQAVGLGAAPNGTVGPLGILTADTSVSGFNAALVHINASAVDSVTTRRLLAVYGTPVHGPKCPRYSKFTAGIFAAKPGDPGCLQKIGCKGPATNSLCGLHGWNNQQPQNPVGYDYGVSHLNTTASPNLFNGGHCPRAGHPCMACTEKGYPDNFVPFVVRS